MKASVIKCISIVLASHIAQVSYAQKASVLIPDYVVVQHAGSIGYLSVGADYDLFKNKRGNLGFNFGMVPEGQGGPLHIVTAKFAYRPIEVNLSKRAKFYPINPGAFFSYHLDKQFDIAFDREQYGKSYYGWSTAVRGYLSASNEIRFTTGKRLKSLTLYSEFNASDLYLASLFFKNNRKWLGADDIIKLGLGIKVGF